jgi:hypothetical protein
MPAKNKKQPFSIGDWVKVKQVAESCYEDKYHRTVKTEGPFPEPIIGQICGAVYRYDGVRDPGYRGSSMWDDGDEPPHFTVKKAHLLWQVRTSITGKPIEAFEQDIEFETLYPLERDALPFRPPQKKWHEAWPDWAQSLKDELRQEMKNWPRDEKGRWKKKK